MEKPTASPEFRPVTPQRWEDMETLFGLRGACGGCWCMYFRLTRKEFDAQRGEPNRQAMMSLVEAGQVPGILVYAGDSSPVGWCSIAPRQVFTLLDRSRLLKPVDDQPVWSVVCFFINKQFRRQGLTVELLNAAVMHAAQQGATIIEGYPIEPKAGGMPDVFAYTGLVSAFKKAGFVEVARRSETRPIMRYYVNNK